MGHVKLILITVLAVLLAVLAGCQSAPPAESIPAASGDAVSVAPADLNNYKLGNGDRLRVTVFNEPTLSGEFVVDGSGLVSMPLVGEIPVAGSTVREFQRAYKDALEPDYLTDARVAAEVLTYRPFYILGEIENPGEYPYSSGLTIMNAIATAGGFTYRANRKVAYVRSIEGGDERRVALTPSTKLQPGDTIRIDERLF